MLGQTADLRATRPMSALFRFNKCPCCHNTEFSILHRNRNRAKIENWRDFFYGKARFISDIYQCTVCGFHFQNDIQEDYQQFYKGSDLSDYLETYYLRVDYSQKIKQILDSVAGLDIPLKPRILDLGCGDGTWLNLWKENGLLFGTELSPDLCKMADLNNITIVNPLTMGAGGYDIISMFDFLEHVENPYEQIEKAYNKLRPGGVMMIGVPDLGKFLPRYLGIYYYLYCPMHFSYFTKKSLISILRNFFDASKIMIFKAPKMYATLGSVLKWLRLKIPLPEKIMRLKIICYSASLICIAQKG